MKILVFLIVFSSFVVQNLFASKSDALVYDSATLYSKEKLQEALKQLDEAEKIDKSNSFIKPLREKILARLQQQKQQQQNKQNQDKNKQQNQEQQQNPQKGDSKDKKDGEEQKADKGNDEEHKKDSKTDSAQKNVPKDQNKEKKDGDKNLAQNEPPKDQKGGQQKHSKEKGDMENALRILNSFKNDEKNLLKARKLKSEQKSSSDKDW
ncbi:hypothetical protein IT568_10530 [bacterium]|nr:hypothetical protein [bacterium]